MYCLKPPLKKVLRRRKCETGSACVRRKTRIWSKMKTMIKNRARRPKSLRPNRGRNCGLLNQTMKMMKRFTNVYVKNFGENLPAEKLEEVFSKFGKITSYY